MLGNKDHTKLLSDPAPDRLLLLNEAAEYCNMDRGTFNNRKLAQSVPPPQQTRPFCRWGKSQLDKWHKGYIKPSCEILVWVNKYPDFENDPDLLKESRVWCEYDPDTRLWTPLPSQYLVAPRPSYLHSIR